MEKKITDIFGTLVFDEEVMEEEDLRRILSENFKKQLKRGNL